MRTRKADRLQKSRRLAVAVNESPITRAIAASLENKVVDELERQDDPKIVAAVHGGETCKAPGCKAPARAKGYCAKDYQRARRRKSGDGTARPGGEVRELPKGKAVEVKSSIHVDELEAIDLYRGKLSRSAFIRDGIRRELEAKGARFNADGSRLS